MACEFHSILSPHRKPLIVTSSSYLRDLARVAARNYEPSDADIVQCRLRTIGVQEYRVDFGISAIRTSLYSISLRSPSKSHHIFSGEGYGREMIIYDVGGCRQVSCALWTSIDLVNKDVFTLHIEHR